MIYYNITFENVSEFVVTKEEICYNCLYDSSGRIGYYKDFLENKSYYYNYDLMGNITGIVRTVKKMNTLIYHQIDHIHIILKINIKYRMELFLVEKSDRTILVVVERRSG